MKQSQDSIGKADENNAQKEVSNDLYILLKPLIGYYKS